MADEVKLYGVGGSPFVCRVEIALNLKGIKYEYIIEEVVSNKKSVDLIKYNPVHKKVPVLVHNGKGVCESLVIVEYIDDVWNNKGVSILPQDPYPKALARFWAKFIEDKCMPAVYKALRSIEDKQVVAKAYEQLEILEKELEGKKFFGGDNINLVDIAATFISCWLGIDEEAAGLKLVTKDKFPKLTEWANNFVSHPVVKKILPPRENLLPYFKKRLIGKK